MKRVLMSDELAGGLDAESHDVLEYDPEDKRLVVTDRLGPNEYSASLVVAYQVVPWFGLWAEATWRQPAPSYPDVFEMDPLQWPEIIDSVMVRRWPSGYSASITLPDAPGFVSRRHWPTPREALIDALSQMTLNAVAKRLDGGDDHAA